MVAFVVCRLPQITRAGAAPSMVLPAATLKAAGETSTVTWSLFRVVCVPAIRSGVSRPWMTWCVSTAVSEAVSAISFLSASRGTASNAALAGARTVTSSWLFSGAPRRAAASAVAKARTAGLWAIAVAAGLSDIPAKLPSPAVGTSPQPVPKGRSVTCSAAVADGDPTGAPVDVAPAPEAAPAAQPPRTTTSAQTAVTPIARPAAVRFTSGELSFRPARPASPVRRGACHAPRGGRTRGQDDAPRPGDRSDLGGWRRVEHPYALRGRHAGDPHADLGAGRRDRDVAPRRAASAVRGPHVGQPRAGDRHARALRRAVAQRCGTGGPHLGDPVRCARDRPRRVGLVPATAPALGPLGRIVGRRAARSADPFVHPGQRRRHGALAPPDRPLRRRGEQPALPYDGRLDSAPARTLIPSVRTRR